MTGTVTKLILEGSQILDDEEGFNIDRSKYLNASSATTCIRKQWYERNTKVKPEQDWGYARRGKQGELYIVDALLAAGCDLEYAGPDQLSIVSEELGISATPDGFLRTELGGKYKAVEFKTIDPRTNRKKLPKAEHVVQVQLAMEIANLQDEDYPHPDEGVLVYMDASNYNEIIEFPVKRMSKTELKKYAQRARALLRAKDVAKLDREGRRDGQCKLYGGCPYAETCGVDLAEKAPRAKVGATVEELVREYVMAKDEAAQLTLANKDRAETIKQHIRAGGGAPLVAGNHVVTLQTVAGSRSFDWAAAAKAGVNIDPFTKVGAPSERLTIK